jgi:DNA-binding MarR family transcriptional regulator
MEREQRKQAKQLDHEQVTLDRKTGRLGMLLHRYRMNVARVKGSVGDPLRGQGRVLALLAAKPETTQRELSYLLDMRQQSLSELLAKLEDKGYVTREKSAQDGRVTVVRLTDAGREKAPSVDDMTHEDDSFDCLTDEERAEYERLVDKVIASLEERLVSLGDDPYAPPRGPRRHEGRGPRELDDRDRREFEGRQPREFEGRGPRGHEGRGRREFEGRGPREFDERESRGPRGPRGHEGRGRREFDERDNERRNMRGPRHEQFRDDSRTRRAPGDRVEGEAGSHRVRPPRRFEDEREPRGRRWEPTRDDHRRDDEGFVDA